MLFQTRAVHHLQAGRNGRNRQSCINLTELDEDAVVTQGSEHLYLLDFVGPRGFVQEVCPHVQRFACPHAVAFVTDWHMGSCRFCRPAYPSNILGLPVSLDSVVVSSAMLPPSRVTVLDHHKTAAENLAGAAAPNLEITLDMERSGATIARDHFAPPGLTHAQQARFQPCAEYGGCRQFCTVADDWTLSRSYTISAAYAGDKPIR